MEKVVPTAQVCICRELTKKFEEISRGTPAELKTRTYRGEIVLVFTVA
jgi:16S rRNA C1402 (ribose-2'-O) methylase RsmI